MAKKLDTGEVARIVVTCNVQGDYAIVLPYEPADGEFYCRRVTVTQRGTMRVAYTKEGRQAIAAGTVTQCGAAELRYRITALFAALMLGPRHAK
jgi:hypothetical protein